MLQVIADVSGPLQLITGMINKVDHFKRVDIGMTMSQWQTEDLHRHKPFTMRSRAKGTAATVVRPHSRFEVLRSRYAERGQARVAKLLAKPRKRAYRGKLAIYRNYRRWSTRPILREEMYVTLTRRMSDALRAKLTFK